MATPTLSGSATSAAPPPPDLPVTPPSAWYRASRWLRRRLLAFYSVLALAYMFLPVAYVIAFSFNKPAGRQNITWNQFSFDAWLNICRDPTICNAVGVSLRLAFITMLFSTILGALISFALVRHKFRGRESTNLLIFLPMATPEVVLGASLLALFLNLNFNLGFGTILIAHIMFCISFVVVTVKARLAGLDPRLEQAAMDLYANEWQTFRRITLPLVFPGIAAAAALAFALSFDDFIITNFNSGQTVTFPMYVWGAAQRGIPPQVNVIGSLMFGVALLLVVLGQVVSRRRSRGR